MKLRHYVPLLTVIVFYACAGQAPPQRPVLVQYAEPRTGTTQLTDSLSIPEEDAGYTLLLPEKGAPKAVVVMFAAGRDTTDATDEMRLYVEAIKRQVAVLYLTSGNRVEFLFDEAVYAQLDGYLHKAITEHNLPADRLLFAGMSLAGTRALKMGIWCMQGKSAFHIRPKAVATCDAPLDFVRFWKALDRSKRLQFEPVGTGEAAWVTAVLERHFSGTPEDHPEAYRQFSPFCHDLDNGGNIQALGTIAFRAYTEPDVQWWMDNRGADFYSMNALDAAGAVNELRLAGNKNAALILSNNKGRRPDGSRHPHSWSVVDNGELVEWLLGLR